jgi:hypothetical protein
MEKSNFSLRLLPSLLKAAQRVAERENCSVNQLINIALAEKLAVLDKPYWDERAEKAKRKVDENPLKRLKGTEPPRLGDKLPEGVASRRKPLRTGKG